MPGPGNGFLYTVSDTNTTIVAGASSNEEEPAYVGVGEMPGPGGRGVLYAPVVGEAEGGAVSMSLGVEGEDDDFDL